MFNNPSIASTILPFIFNYLNFFRLRNMCRISDDFDDIIVEYTKRLCRKKFDLFKNFNLKEFLENINAEKNLFLMKYDEEFTLEKRNCINHKDFKFIMKFFGKFMKTIIIQSECLLNLKNCYQFYIDNLIEIIKEYMNNDEIDIIQIDDSMYSKELLFTRLPSIDLQNNSINKKTIDALIPLKDLLFRRIKLLTDYSDININYLITEFLMHAEIRFLTIAGPSSTSIGNQNLDQCCDRILESFVNKSKNSLQKLTLKSCQIDNFYGLMNEFNNLREIILDNIQYIGSNSLLMSGVTHHRWITHLEIINCPTGLDDDLCYEFITNYFYVNEILFLCLLI